MSPEAKVSYTIVKEALTKQFKPECKCGLRIYARPKQPSESWATFDKELKAPAFPDLDDAERDRLAVDHFLIQLTNPQPAFIGQQIKPKTLEEVVTATLEMQLHLQLTTHAMLPAPTQTDTSVVVGIACSQQCDSITNMLKQLVKEDMLP